MSHEISTENRLEALLFFKNEPVRIEWLAKNLGTSEDEVKVSLEALREGLRDRGVVLLETGGTVALGTHPLANNLVEKIIKDELEHDLGRAGLETLAIVIYKGPISRGRVDSIRGVNSQFTLRHLLARGLVERASDPNDARSLLYKPTISLLAHLGVSMLSDLAEFDETRKKLEEIETRVNEASANTDSYS